MLTFQKFSSWTAREACVLSPGLESWVWQEVVIKVTFTYHKSNHFKQSNSVAFRTITLWYKCDLILVPNFQTPNPKRVDKWLLMFAMESLNGGVHTKPKITSNKCPQRAPPSSCMGHSSPNQNSKVNSLAFRSWLAPSDRFSQLPFTPRSRLPHLGHAFLHKSGQRRY